MLTITAIIRVKPDSERLMHDALVRVAEHVRANEPGTVGFFVSTKLDDPCVFTTYERFVDQAAMDTHNGSSVVADFFAVAKPLLDGAVILETCREIVQVGGQ